VGSYIIEATSFLLVVLRQQEARLYQAATHSLTRFVRILGVELKRKFKFTHDTVLTRPGTNTLDRHRTLAVISTVRHGSGCSPTRHWLE
jgi:hypothetical protein